MNVYIFWKLMTFYSKQEKITPPPNMEFLLQNGLS